MNKNENTQYLDSLLLQELHQSDEKALSFLFSNHYNKLYRTGIRFCQDHHLTEESIQEVFQDLWQYRNSLSNIESFEAYLVTSLKRRISRKAGKSESKKEENLDNYNFPVASFEEILIKQETDESLKISIKNALNELSPRQKEIIVFKYFDELTYAEIAIKTGLQIDSIYKTLHEGIKKLKNVLFLNI